MQAAWQLLMNCGQRKAYELAQLLNSLLERVQFTFIKWKHRGANDPFCLDTCGHQVPSPSSCKAINMPLRISRGLRLFFCISKRGKWFRMLREGEKLIDYNEPHEPLHWWINLVGVPNFTAIYLLALLSPHQHRTDIHIMYVKPLGDVGLSVSLSHLQPYGTSWGWGEDLVGKLSIFPGCISVWSYPSYIKPSALLGLGNAFHMTALSILYWWQQPKEFHAFYPPLAMSLLELRCTVTCQVLPSKSGMGFFCGSRIQHLMGVLWHFIKVQSYN